MDSTVTFVPSIARGSSSTSILTGRLGDDVALHQYRNSEEANVSNWQEREWLKIKGLFKSYVSELKRYEETYGMDSETFYSAFESGEIDEERVEYYKWRSIYSAYLHMCHRYDLSR